MGNIKPDNFLTEAESLLNQGRPGAARECLAAFSSNSFAVAEPRYQQLMAAAELLVYYDSGEHEGGSRLEELSGVDAYNEFLKLYIRSIEALARRKPPLRTKYRARRREVIIFNINYAIDLCKEINGSAVADELEDKLEAIRPQS